MLAYFSLALVVEEFDIFGIFHWTTDLRPMLPTVGRKLAADLSRFSFIFSIQCRKQFSEL